MWSADNKESLDHLNTCKNPDQCRKCVHIQMSSQAMNEYADIKKIPASAHPLHSYIIRTFKER